MSYLVPDSKSHFFSRVRDVLWKNHLTGITNVLHFLSISSEFHNRKSSSQKRKRNMSVPSSAYKQQYKKKAFNTIKSTFIKLHRLWRRVRRQGTRKANGGRIGPWKPKHTSFTPWWFSVKGGKGGWGWRHRLSDATATQSQRPTQN